VLHVQVVTLLLHQHCVGEALAEFRAHIAAFQQPPLPPPPAAAAAHFAWLVRQYTVMAELLSMRVDPALLPTQARHPQCDYLHCLHSARSRVCIVWSLRVGVGTIFDNCAWMSGILGLVVAWSCMNVSHFKAFRYAT
jgi:hypothetical protein